MYPLSNNDSSTFSFPWRIKRKVGSMEIITFTFALISICVVAGVLLFLIVDSLPIFKEVGLAFYTESEWHPSSGEYGALSMIYGSIAVTFIAICFAVPLALVSAIFVSEILSHKLRFYAKASMELLAGVPSIIYGLLGIEIVNRYVKSGFDLNDGSTLLSAAIVLAIMILPTIMTISEDAIHNVSKEYRQAARGLGLTRSETIFGAVFPNALPGVYSSILLGVSNAIGETMAVMLVIGSIDRLPQPIYDILDPTTTITSKLGRDAAESLSAGLQWNAMSALGLTLFIVVALIMYLSRSMSSKAGK